MHRIHFDKNVRTSKMAPSYTAIDPITGKGTSAGSKAGPTDLIYAYHNRFSNSDEGSLPRHESDGDQDSISVPKTRRTTRVPAGERAGVLKVDARTRSRGRESSQATETVPCESDEHVSSGAGAGMYAIDLAEQFRDPSNLPDQPRARAGQVPTIL